MGNKVVVRTEKGRPDSLTKAVQIVFTLTPVESEGVTTSYDPVAIGHMVFPPNVDERQGFDWITEFAIENYKEKADQGRKSCAGQGSHAVILPGRAYYQNLTTSWANSGALSLASKRQPLIHAANFIERALGVALLIKSTSLPFKPILAYHPPAVKDSIKISAELVLQAYVVEGEGDYNGDILTAKHLKQPLLDKPVYCNALPDISTWRLYQDPNGAIKLTEASNPSTTHSFELVAESISELKKQLSGVLTVLEVTQERLAVIETAVATNHTDLSAELKDTREKISRLDQVVPLVHTRVTELEGLATRNSRDWGKPAHIPITGIRDQSDDSHHKLTVLMPKPRTVQTPAFGQDSLSRDKTSLTTVREQPSKAAPTPVGSNSPQTSAGQASFRGDGALQFKKVEEPSGESVAMPTTNPQNPISEAPIGNRELFVVQESVRTLRKQVAGLDRRVPTLESKMEKLANGFGKTLENLASVHRFLQNHQQQSAAMEVRVPAVEAKAEQLTDHMVDLASRLTTMEERAETLSESLADIRETRLSGWPSFSPSVNPSASLPSGVGLNSTIPVDGSETGSLPWLSLPQSLDVEFDGGSRGDL